MKKRMMITAVGLTLAAIAAHAQTWPETLKSLTDRQVLAGAVTCVANADTVLETTASGWADIEQQRPMTPDTMFWIASQTKGFTGAALMMLVDEGKVSLDDPVAKFIPKLKDLWVIESAEGDRMTLLKARAPVTVRQVMSHTSGYPFLSPQEKNIDAAPLREKIAVYAQTPLLAEPGTRYQYSNIGINIAGYIIEVVSGMPYETFLQKRLFDPLGLTDTVFWLTPEQEARLARCYRPNWEQKLEPCPHSFMTPPFTDRANRFAEPGGGLFSTAHDVTRFCRMLLNGGILDGKRILSEDAVRALSTKQTGDAVPNEYGLGFEAYGWGFKHGGAQGTHMAVLPPQGLVLVYLIQHAGFIKDKEKEGNAAPEVFRALSVQQHGKK
ncbi:MAG: beta-lactamase family protein [Kiritimatiellaeota bacterium]|nr:beta-lactamase family protein [Kiritimatiellota bacterium]